MLLSHRYLKTPREGNIEKYMLRKLVNMVDSYSLSLPLAPMEDIFLPFNIASAMRLLMSKDGRWY